MHQQKNELNYDEDEVISQFSFVSQSFMSTLTVITVI